MRDRLAFAEYQTFLNVTTSILYSMSSIFFQLWKQSHLKSNHGSIKYFPDPDRIVRIENERTELNNLDDIMENGRNGGRSSPTSNSLRSFGRNSFLFRSTNKSQKSKKHPTPRRREVLLSKISIYIVYMFVCCHR